MKVSGTLTTLTSAVSWRQMSDGSVSREYRKSEWGDSGFQPFFLRGFAIKWFIGVDVASRSRDRAINTRKSQRCGGLRGNPCKNQFGEGRLSERSFSDWFIRYDALVLREKPKSLVLVCIKNVKKSNRKNILSHPVAKSGRAAQGRQSGCVPGGRAGWHSLCVWLCDPMGCSPPGCSVHGISQARRLEWVFVPFSRGSSGPRDWTLSPTWQAGWLPLAPPGKPRGSAPWEQLHLLVVDSGHPSSQD